MLALLAGLTAERLSRIGAHPDSGVVAPGHTQTAASFVALAITGFITARVGLAAIRATKDLPEQRFVSLGAVVLFSGTACMESARDWEAARRFQREGCTTSGQIVEVHPEDHGKVVVLFEANKTRFRESVPGPPDSLSLPPAAQVTVYYPLSNPRLCSLKRPEWDAANTVLWILFVGGLFPGAAACLGAGYARRRGRSAQANAAAA